MSAPGKPLISVLILTANRRAALERCLRSLAAQGYPAFEVVVVDNGSTDGTREWLAEQSIVPAIRVVEGGRDANLAASRNRAAQAAAGALLAYIDDDCEARPGWLAGIAENLADVDAVGGLCEPPPDLIFPRWWHESLNWTVGLSGPEASDPRAAGSQWYPQTANMAVRRDVLRREPFQDIGGKLDQTEHIMRHSQEDSELWRRLRLRGYRTRVDPRLRVIHHIPHDRLNWGFVKRRVRMEGACFWERDSEPVLIDFAVEDLLSWPGRAVRSLARFPDGVLPEWRRHAAWRMRQAAFVHQAAKDIGWAKVARRTARVTLRRLRAWAKCATRPVISTTLRLVNGKLWPRLPGEPEHILIACQGFLGDTIVIGPMIDALRRQWPGARLTLLTNRHGRVLHGANSRLDEVIEISRPRFLADWERWKEVRRAMRRLTVDVMIVPYWHATPVWPLLVSQRAPAIGFDRDTGFRRQLWHSLLDRRVHKDFEQNEVANLLALGKALGAEKEPPRDLCIPPLPKPTPVVLSFLEEHGLREGGFTVLHMDGFGMGKVWPTTKWAALARRLSEEWPELRLVFVGLSRLRLQVHRLIEDTGIDAVNDCANRPLGDLAEIVRRARLVVSTDSGPKHMAILMKTPSVTLYGHTTPKQWGPWIDREMHRSIVSPGIDLRPEELGPRPIDHKISLISVDDVLSAVREALGEPAVVPPA